MVTTIDPLTTLIQRFDTTGDIESFKQGARSLLSTLQPVDRLVAEQKLVQAGLAPEDLRQY